ncbi:MAG: Zn-ribbon domain-containing OB-fold protein [Candidatus Delongbacteria bacterium]|nr:Zn-ribbon domain-containing OB-fold protein [Candidatus Delongbacteria bacterium]
MSTSAKLKREMPQRYRMEAGKCTTCGYIAFPPRSICPECQAREFDTVILPDEGTILTHTVIRVAPSQFTDEAPYAIAIIELGEGARVLCQLVDCDLEQIAIGDPVKIEFRRIQAEGKSGVLFYGYKAVPA